jgi:hypothetical protein
MILGEEELPRISAPRGHKGRNTEPDPSDREAFVVTVPNRLIQESSAVWPTWLAPPGLPSNGATRISGAFSGVPGSRPDGPKHSDARRSPLGSPPPTEA